MSKPKEQPLKEQSAGQVAWEWIKSGIIGFMIFLVVRTFLIQTFTIVSGSMENTLLIGDFLVLNKSAYGATVPMIGKRLPGNSRSASVIERPVMSAVAPPED